MTNNHYGRLTATCARLLAVCVILLHGCSGGISGTGDGGTGDGGPTEDVDINDNLVDLDVGSTDSQADNGMDVIAPEQTLLPEIYYAFPAPLVGEQNTAGSTQSVYQPLREQFTTVNGLLLNAQVWIDLVSTELPIAQSTCNDDSDCLAAQLSASYVYTADIMALDLNRRLASLDPAISEDERSIRESSIRDQLIANLDTVIDLTVGNYQSSRQIRITSNGAALDLTWQPNQVAAAVRYTDSSITLHALHSEDNSRFTFRLHDRATALLLAAAFEFVDNGLLYEADFHQITADQDRQSYVRGFSDQLDGTLVSRHPDTNSGIPMIRERYLSNGQLVSLQQCDNCETAPFWQEQLANPTESEEQYALFESRFGQFEQTIADDINVTNLSESTNEWLVTSGDPNVSPNDNGACSGQRVGSDLRSICWAIEINSDQAQVFQELLLSNGELVYQLLE